MNSTMIRSKDKGNALMDYLILLGIILAVLIVMNVYIKRGVQAKVKDMTDNFISSEQLADANSPSVTSSTSRTDFAANSESNMLEGGGIQSSSTETTDVFQSSVVSDPDLPYKPPFIPYTDGDIPMANRESGG
jgi:hypothetical protein